MDLKQFLHRGTIVVNSNYIDAVVLYTGKDTKIVMNQGAYRFKQSQLDKAINWITVWNMTVMFLLALIMATRASVWNNEYINVTTETSGAFYIFQEEPENVTVKVFGSFYLLFNQFIPFELLIILEMVKMYYSVFIQEDVVLQNIEAGKSCMVQNLSIIEELAQIQYMFCDKTGTLTKNMLIFKCMAVMDQPSDQNINSSIGETPVSKMMET